MGTVSRRIGIPLLAAVLLAAPRAGAVTPPGHGAPHPSAAPAVTGAAAAAPAGEQVQLLLHVLDYVAVDYPGAVKDGQVASRGEYDEQVEFVAQARGLIGRLQARPERAALAADADRLVAAVDAKRPGDEVAELATRLRWAIVRAYDVEIAPRRAPDLAHGAALFTSQCAPCHGAEGRGDGPAGRGLDPPPINFHDAERMTKRSVYGLYSTITLGVSGTAMASFRALSDADRWALAFHVANLGADQAALRRGEALAQKGGDRATFPDLASIATRSARDIESAHGPEATALLMYLRRHPDRLVPTGGGAIARSAERLRDSVAAYREGRARHAQDLATSSYLDGFEPVEASLDVVDPGLRAEVEAAMTRYRALLRAGAPAGEVEVEAAKLERLLARAQDRLDSASLSPGATFLSALVIVLREGLEAILVVAAIYALVARAGRREAVAYVHGGWVLALAAGGLTWLVASYVVAVSGATREVTEGVSALAAAAILLYVGFWMHGKSQAHQWQAYLDRRLSVALAGRARWALAAVSFLAVYREAFETVLFYEALAAQAGPGGRAALFGGLGAGAAALLVLGSLVVRGSLRLPLGQFFTASAALLGLLAVVLAGKGIAALQEAGWVPVHEVRVPSLPALGLYPTLQSLVLQAALVLLIAAGVVYLRRAPRRPS